MVVENLVETRTAEKHPWRLILLGALYTVIGCFLAVWVFQSHASIVSVFLTTLAAVPLMYNVIKFEESKDLQDLEEKFLIKEHGKALKAFIALFIGMTLAFSTIYILMPSPKADLLFKAQQETISAINSKVVGQSVGFTSNAFVKILSNNVKVLLFAFLFSFLYGFGAIFILTWNASVIGTAIGNVVKVKIMSIASTMGAVKIANYFAVIPLAVLRYAIHGIPEILAYFTAGLAGGIVSVAVIRHEWSSRKFEHIILDSADLLLLSFALLLIAAVLEVFVTPLVSYL